MGVVVVDDDDDDDDVLCYPMVWYNNSGNHRLLHYQYDMNNVWQQKPELSIEVAVVAGGIQSFDLSRIHTLYHTVHTVCTVPYRSCF